MVVFLYDGVPSYLCYGEYKLHRLTPINNQLTFNINVRQCGEIFSLHNKSILLTQFTVLIRQFNQQT
jgi:hypothetical protein